MAASPYSAPSQLTPNLRSHTTLHLSNSTSSKTAIGAIKPIRFRPITACLSATLPNGSICAELKRDHNPIIVIDNYDSFTYNLCQVFKHPLCNFRPSNQKDQTVKNVGPNWSIDRFGVYMGELGANFEVYRNDELTVEDIRRMNPMGILISPGPGAPRDSGISLQTVLELGPTIPIFGVCMGLQCIGEAFGGKIVRSPTGVVHGKGSLVYYDEKVEPSLFQGLSNPFQAGRYHSLVIENDSFPNDALEITAWSEDGLVMAARHRKYKHIQGVQFHPESIITTEGKTIVLNFINFVKQLRLNPLKNEN